MYIKSVVFLYPAKEKCKPGKIPIKKDKHSEEVKSMILRFKNNSWRKESKLQLLRNLRCPLG